MGYPPVGAGSGTGGGVSARYFVKKDGDPAIFANTAARDSYFTANPDDLKKVGSSPVGVGTANRITAAYVYDKGKKSWFPIATNFKGDPGPRGKPAPGVDLSALAEGEIPKWDSKLHKLVPSGVESPSDGELLIAPSSVLFGNSSMSSSIENIIFKNLHTGKIYAPAWQEVGAGKSSAFVREYDENVRQVVRVPAGNVDVMNPVNRNIRIDADEIFIGGKFTLSLPATNLMLEIYESTHNKLVWRQRLGDRPAGEVSVTFGIPFDVRTGYEYDIKLLSEDGSDVTAKSNSSTGFSWEIDRATWEDVELATQKWVQESSPASGNAITGVALSGQIMTFTHADGAKHSIELPVGAASAKVASDLLAAEQKLAAQGVDIADLKTKYGAITHNINVLTSVFTYSGSTAPTYPAEAKGHYFVTMTGNGPTTIQVPLPENSIDGTMYTGYNENSNSEIVLEAASGETVGGNIAHSFPSNNSIILVKQGKDWKIVSQRSLSNAQLAPLTAAMVSKAIDHGAATDGGSIKSLADGWWLIPATLTSIRGRPRGSQGDLIYFRKYVGGSYAVGMIFGKDRDGASSMWVQYKDGSKWTSWLPITGSADLTSIQSDMASLKLGEAAAVSRIERLETQIGKIYAPSKILFDSAVNALIDAKLAAYIPTRDPQVAKNLQELETLKRDMLTVNQIEAALKAKGWGPLSGGVTPSGGGDKPAVIYPTIVTMFTNSIPTSISEDDSATSSTGTATLTRTDTTSSRLWVLVENDNDEADKVKSFSINKGMEAVWQSRDIVIGGKKYRAFYSAGAYTETTVSVQVNLKE